MFERDGERMLHIFDPGTAKLAAEAATVADSMGELSIDAGRFLVQE